MKSWTFAVPGSPVPKGRPRLGKAGVYTPKRTKAYELKVAQCALAAGTRCAPAGRRVSLEIEAYLKREADLDNLVKSVSDALNGIAYLDDRQVTQLVARKQMDDNPHLVVRLRWIEV